MRRRAPAPGRRDDPAARPGPARRPGRDPRDRRGPAPDDRLPGQAARRRDPRDVPLLLPQARRRERTGRGARAGRQAQGLLPVAVRRAAAAAVGRAGPDRPAEDRGAGRDDHGPGPAGPPGHLGADRAHPRPRHHDPAGHPLHGRGRTALRSRGPHRPRPHRGAGHPGRAHRPGQGRQDGAVPAVRAVRRAAADRTARGIPGRARRPARGGDRDRRARQRGAVRPARGRAGGAGRAAGRLHAGGRLRRAHRHAPARGTQGKASEHKEGALA